MRVKYWVQETVTDD